MYHISASNRIWAFKFFMVVGGVGVTSHAHAHLHMCIHACATDVRGCKQKGNKGISKALSIFVQIKVKIIKYGFKHTECRLAYVYIMLINFICDVHSLKHTKVNRYNGANFSQISGQFTGPWAYMTQI